MKSFNNAAMNEAWVEIKSLKEKVGNLEIITEMMREDLYMQPESPAQPKEADQYPVDDDGLAAIKKQARFEEKSWRSEGEVMRDIRLGIYGLSRAEVARWMGTSTTSLRKYENGWYPNHNSVFTRAYQSFIIGYLEKQLSGRYVGGTYKEKLMALVKIAMHPYFFVEQAENYEGYED